MNTLFGRATATAIGVLAWAVVGPVNASGIDVDRPGVPDHPLMSRYAGSTLFVHGGENYGSAPMLVRGLKRLEVAALEGKVTNRLY